MGEKWFIVGHFFKIPASSGIPVLILLISFFKLQFIQLHVIGLCEKDTQKLPNSTEYRANTK